MTEKINEWLVKSLGEPDNSNEDHGYEIRPLTVEGRREWWMFHNGVGSGEPLAQWLEAYAAQQSKIKLPNPSIDEIEKMAVDNFSSTVYADIISWTIRWMHKEAQQSKIHKPDVNLEYWQKWLIEHGYQIEFDDDGLWAEDWVQEHKWVDIFDLMMQFAIEQQSKTPTAPLK